MVELLPARRLTQVLLSAALASLVLIPPFWAASFGLPGAIAASALFGGIFIACLHAFRVEESAWLIRMVTSRIAVMRGSS